MFGVLISFNPLNAELNPICHLLALLGAHHILHVSGLRVKMDCLKNIQIRRLTNNMNTSIHVAVSLDKIYKYMGGACSTYGGRGEAYTGFGLGNLRARDRLGDPGVGGRIILRRILRKWDVGP